MGLAQQADYWNNAGWQLLTARSCFGGIITWFVLFAVLYFVLKSAVTAGMLKAWQKRDEARLREAVKAEQAAQAAAAAKRASRGP